MLCAQVLLYEVYITLNFGITHQTCVIIYFAVIAHPVGFHLAMDLSDMLHARYIVTLLFTTVALVGVPTVPWSDYIPTCGVGIFGSWDMCVSLLWWLGIIFVAILTIIIFCLLSACLYIFHMFHLSSRNLLLDLDIY